MKYLAFTFSFVMLLNACGGDFSDEEPDIDNLPPPSAEVPIPIADSDEDGIDDDLDQCPNESGPEPLGCPLPSPGDGDTDNDGVIDRTDLCPTVPANTSNGCPDNMGVVLPGKIEAEDYDAYFDTTSANEGGEYRNDSVDIESTSDFGEGYLVGWTATGEWIDFNIFVGQRGLYELSARVASQPGGGVFAVLIDGAQIGENFTVDSTGGWDTWQTSKQNVGELTPGQHTLRILVDSGLFNVNWLVFSLVNNENPDTDRDGVPDSIDICADTPGVPENMGCPIEQPADYDLANGMKEYAFRCSGCHDDPNADIKGTNIFLSYQQSDIVGSNGRFNCTLTSCENIAELAAYIDKNMPFGGETCEGKCAQDAAYYINQTMGKGIEPVIDSDRDGVPDSQDNCPSDVGPASNNGCPVVVIDSDDDGVPDSQDNCDNEPGPASSNGCPLVPSGAALYEEKNCVTCHGPGAAGVEVGGNLTGKIVLENWTQPLLTQVIDSTMPKNASGQCIGECASAIATYLMGLVTEVSCNDEQELLPRRLRLLTPKEFENSVNQLLGLNKTDIASRLPVTATVRGFDNNAPQTAVSSTHMDQYWNVAVEVSKDFDASNLLDCGAQSEAQCAQNFVRNFGLKAFRRPLTNDEIDSYVDIFDLSADLTIGARYVVRTMLVSSAFLYRSEIGSSSGANFALTPYETASLLSFTFWGMGPDQTLLNEAEADRLRTSGQLRAQVTRLLQDDRAKTQFTHFAKQWLRIDDLSNLDKSDSEYPIYNDTLASAMEQEVKLLISDLFLNGVSDFGDLFTNDYVYVNNTLANFYGINGVSGSEFTTAPAGDQRGGILNLGGFLASLGKRDQSSPILRGVYVREHLLCQEFSQPPPNVGEVEPLDPNKSTRERFAAHTNNPGCSSCHSKIDPIGFSFERYDGIGRFRLTEGNNILVDDSGILEGLVNLNDTDSQPYSGTKGLASILAGSENVATCFVDHFHTYLEGVANPDTCQVQQVSERWKNESYTLYDLWLESVSSDNFLIRR